MMDAIGITAMKLRIKREGQVMWEFKACPAFAEPDGEVA
jgi:hypothetical protein